MADVELPEAKDPYERLIAILVRWTGIYFAGLAVGVFGDYQGIIAFLM